MQDKVIGVLAIQGGFSLHFDAIKRLGYTARMVKTSADLAQVTKLIMPGGESTVMRLLLQKHDLWNSLQEFVTTRPVFGTCAGAILLAKTIDTGEVSLNAIDLDIKRNSYGRQINSFAADLPVDFAQKKLTLPSMFIRAPEITRVGTEVRVLARHNELPVLVQEKRVLIATFHPELTTDDTLCDYFIREV